MENLQDVLAAIAVAAGQRAWGRGTWFERETEAVGHRVVHTTTNAILSGSYRHKPTPDTLSAFARVAERYGVAGSRVFNAAGQPQRAGEFAQLLPDDVDELGPRSRALVIDTIRLLLELERAAGVPQNVVPIGRDFQWAPPDVTVGVPHPSLPSVTRYSDDGLRVADSGHESLPGTEGDGHEFDA